MKKVILSAAVLLVTGVMVFAGAPGEGVKAGDFVISPYGCFDVTYDSNVEVAPENEKDDVSATLKIGALLKNTAEMLKLQAELWGLVERYADLTAEDHEDFGEAISLEMFDREQVQLKLKQSFKNITSLDYGTGSVEPRKMTDVSLGAGRTMSDKIEMDASYGYKRTDYDSSVIFYDWDEQTVMLSGSHKLTDKTDAQLSSSWSLQTSDGNTEDADFYTVLAGIKTRNTEKVTADAGFGWSWHKSDESISMPAFGVNLKWKATEKVTVDLGGQNKVEPASQDENNYNITTRANIGADWQLMDEYAIGVKMTYVQNDYDRDVESDGVMKKKKDDTFEESIKLTYTPPAKFLTAFAEIKFADKTATIASNEYQQNTVALGIEVKY